MFEKLHSPSKHNRPLIGAGSVLAALGLATIVWGKVEYDSTIVALNRDQKGCNYQDVVACERLPAERKAALDANDIIGNGVALGMVAAGTLWLAYSWDIHGQNKQLGSATSIELSFDKKLEYFLQDRIPRDADVPRD